MLKYTLLCWFTFLLFGCMQPTAVERKNEFNDIGQKNSDTSLINRFRNDIIAAKDSLSKYRLVDVSNTCIKYIYTIYGTKHLRKYDSLTIVKCNIQLTDFKRISDNEIKLHYTFFVNDSVPIIPELRDNEGSVLHTFIYSKEKKKIIKGYLGQHTTSIGGDDIKSLYESLIRIK